MNFFIQRAFKLQTVLLRGHKTAANKMWLMRNYCPKDNQLYF